MNVGELVFEITDRATVLIREEIELAKTEVTEKLNRLLQGSVTAIAAGVFVLLALAMIMQGSPGCSTTSSSRTTSGPAS